MPKLYRFSYRSALLLVCAIFAALTLVGLFSTAAVEIGYSETNSEHVVFLPDSILGNLAACLAAGVIFTLLSRVRVTKTLLAVSTAVLLAAVTGFGLAWVFSVRAYPGADSLSILEGAMHMARGETGALRNGDYFRTFPFQLGYLLYAEAFCRAFGEPLLFQALSIANVLWLDGAYLALLAITRQLFDDDTVSFFTAALCLLCWQPVFFTTFLYGFLPGLALALWGTYFALRSMRTGRARSLIPAIPLFALAILLKKNFLIPLIAVCIALLLHCMVKRKARLLAVAAPMALCALLLPVLVQKSYERRTGAAFGPGTPQSAWLVTGVSESSFCSGWFGGYTTNILRECDYDQALVKRRIAADLRDELSKFQGRPRYLAAFFYHKITGQWNEPQFQSIWSSAAGEHRAPPAPWVENVYTGPASRFLFAYFDRYTLVVYLAFAVSMLLLRRAGPSDGDGGSDRSSGLLILPVAVLGAFLYHAAFEAKAQYSLIYLPMLLPYGAYALHRLGDAALEKGKKRLTPQ